MIEEQKVKAVVDAYVHANKWQTLADELASSLGWALKYGTFEVSEDNLMHSSVHLKAIEALSKYKVARRI